MQGKPRPAAGGGRRGMLAGLALLLPSLSACGTSRTPAPRRGVPGEEAGGDWSCVPYARSRSGLQLAGDAWEWWEAAARAGLDRDARPRAGSVLVLMRTSRLRQGHVAVVSRVVGAREIRVDHANWGSGAGKGRIARDQPVQDVSPGNDWTLVRVWYPRIDDFGQSNWPAFGFVHPRRAMG